MVTAEQVEGLPVVGGGSTGTHDNCPPQLLGISGGPEGTEVAEGLELEVRVIIPIVHGEFLARSPLGVQAPDPLLDRYLPWLRPRGDVLDEGSGIEPQLLGHGERL